tara:strand:- start:905 stop:1636 length:732 start_codon:yes stop_codon:yes gene_type:complete
MKNTITTITLILSLIGNSYSQNTEVFAKKITEKMCNCIGNVEKYESLKPKLDSCYDKSINDAAIHATSEEIKIIGNLEDFNKVKYLIGKFIKTDCEAVKSVVIEEAKPSTNDNPYPTNFTTKDLKKAVKKPNSYNGKIIAFDGKIIKVNSLGENKPYLKVELENGQSIWVGSMVNSQYDKVGNSIRFLGYYSLVEKNEIEFNKSGFHILTFGEVDFKTKQLAFMPGSESQIKEWGKGQIPKGK